MHRSHFAASRFLLPAFMFCLLCPHHSRAQDTRPRAVETQEKTVTVQVDGRIVTARSSGTTVADALKSAGVTLGAYDACSPDPASPLATGMTIAVRCAPTSVETRTEPIRSRTRVVASRRLRRGLTWIKQHPADGLKQLTYRLTWREGRVVERELLESHVLRAVRDKIIHVGGSLPRLPSRGGYFTGERILVMTASGYDPGPRSCGRSADGRTYTGMRARRGVVAVDPRVIPLGARLYVEGYGNAIAGDIGSAIKGNRIDLCFSTYHEACAFGLKKVKVWILSD